MGSNAMQCSEHWEYGKWAGKYNIIGNRQQDNRRAVATVSSRERPDRLGNPRGAFYSTVNFGSTCGWSSRLGKAKKDRVSGALVVGRDKMISRNKYAAERILCILLEKRMQKAMALRPGRCDSGHSR